MPRRETYATLQYRESNNGFEGTWIDNSYYAYHSDARIAMEALREHEGFKGNWEWRILDEYSGD